MSNWKRQAEKRAEASRAAEVERRIREGEARRKEALTMWERIEEADASADVKEILHMIAEKVGLE